MRENHSTCVVLPSPRATSKNAFTAALPNGSVTLRLLAKKLSRSLYPRTGTASVSASPSSVSDEIQSSCRTDDSSDATGTTALIAPSSAGATVALKVAMLPRYVPSTEKVVGDTNRPKPSWRVTTDALSANFCNCRNVAVASAGDANAPGTE